MSAEAIQTLTDLIARPDGSWSLCEGAIAIARIGHPLPDPRVVTDQLEALADEARDEIGDAEHPRFVAAAISRVLFDAHGFRVPTEPEEAAERVYIDQLLASSLGTAPLLALVFVDVARRCGHRFEPIALPGFAYLRAEHGERPFLFDPASGGAPRTLEQCRQAVAAASGGRAEFREGWLRPLTRAQLLARLLSNLKALFWREGQYESALTTIRLLLTIRPDDPREIRDSGRLQFLLGRYREAIGAFEAYLAHNPRGEDADAVRMLLREARAGLGSRA